MQDVNPSAPLTDPGPDPLTGLDPWPTLANARNNSAITARNNASLLNASVIFIYQGKFADWKISVDAGRIDNTNPPQPPPAWVTGVDPATGYSYVAVGGSPICPMPPIPESRVNKPPIPPGNISLGNRISGDWFQCLQDDTFPVGQSTPPITSKDGVTGIFQKYGSPVGNGWYLLTAKVGV